MTVKDRTIEFTSIVENLKAKRTNTIVKRIKKSQKTEFSTVANEIGLAIASTSEKLERLTKLAKRRSLFDDPVTEIQELTEEINNQIKSINSQISILQQKKDSIHRNQQIESHSDTIVNTLKGKLQKTTKGFSDILEIRTENLKAQQKDKENFTGSYLSPDFGKRTVESPLYKPSYTTENSSNNEVVVDVPQQFLLSQDRFISSRSDAVANIEKTITELQLIFRQLASLVAEQQEQIERIDHDVDLTQGHVQKAQSALLSYLSSVSSNRWLMIKVFCVLIFFALIFIIFFV
jgi:syntaxin 5